MISQSRTCSMSLNFLPITLFLLSSSLLATPHIPRPGDQKPLSPYVMDCFGGELGENWGLKKTDPESVLLPRAHLTAEKTYANGV